MIKAAVRLEKVGNLTERGVQILKILVEELGDREGFVEYTDIARRTGIPRSSVKYIVEHLILDGTVQLVNGQLSVRDSIIWYEE